MFPKVGVFSKGYDPAKVDEFLEEAHGYYEQDNLPPEFTSEFIHSATFPLVRGGYDTRHVDRAIDRLEVAYWQRKRAEAIEESGAEEWLNSTYELATTLYPRLSKPHGERFKAPSKGRGYKRSEVDALLDRVGKYFDGKDALAAKDVRHAAFSQARKSEAYDERVVDVYLDRVISVLQAVE